MRHSIFAHAVSLTLALLCTLPAQAARHKAPPPRGKPIRTIDNRVTVFYRFKAKDGTYQKMATVSKTVFVKVFKPTKTRTP